MTAPRIAALAVAAAIAAGSAIAADQRTTSVGIPAKIENLVLPGTELEVKPLDDRQAKLIVRLTHVEVHGAAYRYDFIYQALEPGSYDLRELLQRKDGSALGELPPILVTVDSVLPPGQVLPHELSRGDVPFFARYGWWLIAAGVVWVVVFLAILVVGRSKPIGAELVAARSVSLADRLRPLVERGLAGQLSLEERAGLERALLAFWTRRLHLETARPRERFARLRADPDAGPLLTQLEVWLHKPGPQAEVDLTSLLEPYRDLPADAIDEPEVVVR